MNSTEVSSAPSPSSSNLTEEIKISLLDHNASFDALLRCIPAKYYIKEEEIIIPSAPLTKAQKKAAKKKSQETSVKLAKSDALRKAKLARYDPDEPKTIPEIQAAKIEAALLKKKGKSKATSTSSWESGSDSDSASDNSDDDEEEDGSTHSSPPGSDEEEDSPNDTDFEDSDEEEITIPNNLRHPKEYKGEEIGITELREKMKLKIAGMQANKRGRHSVLSALGGVGAKGEVIEGGSPAEENSVSKEELLEERRKARGLLRDNRRRKRKAERRDEKPKARGKEAERIPSNGKKGGGKANAPIREPREEEEFEEGDRPRKKSKATPPNIKSAPVPIPTSTAVVVSTSSLPLDLTPSTTPKTIVKAPKASSSVDASLLSFSTLDFSTTALLAANVNVNGGKLDKNGALKIKKNKHSLPKDPNAALEVLAKRKERMEALNPEQRERKEEKDRWEKVGLKAEGEKVRDDEKRLKKMAKRQEKIKSKSAKAWAERKETVSSTINAKVAKRNTNMAARAKQVKDKKAGIKVKSKTGNKTTSKSFSSRGKPGFEGSKKKK